MERMGVKGKLKRLEGRVREGAEVVVILLSTKREGCHGKTLKEKELETKKAEMFKTMQQQQLQQNMQKVLLQQHQQQNQAMMSLLQQILLKETNSFQEGL